MHVEVVVHVEVTVRVKAVVRVEVVVRVKAGVCMEVVVMFLVVKIYVGACIAQSFEFGLFVVEVPLRRLRFRFFPGRI